MVLAEPNVFPFVMILLNYPLQFSSVQFSHSVVPDSF